MPRKEFLGALLFHCLFVSVAWSADAVVVPGESRTTAARFVEARKKIADKKYSEALDDLQAILETAGNDLVPLTPQHCVQARRLCHLEFSKLPPEALRVYRARVDAPAKKWLDEAVPTRNVRLLRRIVDEAFCSRAGELAVDLLGNLAFERGDLEEAMTWWRLLAPALTAKKDRRDELALVYPEMQGDRAALYAKQIVARFFTGAAEEAKRDLQAFQRAFPNSEGQLAGRKGKYVELLQGILKESANLERSWSTFGGDGTRGLVLPAPSRWLERLGRTVKDGPTWRFNLETRSPYEEAPPPGFGIRDSRASSLAFHPLICGHSVIVSDARYVTAYNLHTGKATTLYDVRDRNVLAEPNLKLPAPADLRYTLTADHDCLYVRLGAQSLLYPEDLEHGDARKYASFLACLSLDPAAKERRARWCMRPMVRPGKPETAQNNAVFEGAPVVHDGSLYVAVTWFEGDRTVTALQCYPAGTETTPSLRWQQIVCETQELKPKEPRTRHHLVTIAGPNVVYCSHSGAIVAVDALTGKTAWAVRYPSKTPTNADEPALRDLTPCVYAAGRLYVAPTDQDRISCLDPLTGEMLWEHERVAVTHLLGVGNNRLFFTTLLGLHAVDAADGSDSWTLPDGGGKLAPMGRGFLIGDVIVWPTTAGVFVRRQEDGAPAEMVEELQRVPSGNLIYREGVLAVADRTTLSVFVPQEAASKDVGGATSRDREGAGRYAAANRSLTVSARQGDFTRQLTPPLRLPLQRISSSPSGSDGLDPVARFQQANGRLFFLQGEDRLFALDAGSGKVLWSRWAPGAKLHLSPPRGRFHPTILATSTTVFVQPTPGRIWLLDARTGKLLHTESNGFEPWPRPPLAVDDKTAVVVLDARTVALFDLLTGKPIWTHDIADAAPAIGDAPQIIADHDNILLLTANNLGATLQRLDRGTGKPLWQKPPLLESKTPVDASGWTLDKDAIYCTLDQVLAARSLADGKLLWQQALLGANSGWRTRLLGEGVLAYPMQGNRRQIQFRWLWFRLQCELNLSRRSDEEVGMPVLCCDAKSGRLVQRLNLVAGSPHSRLRLGFARFVRQPRLDIATVDASPQFALSRTELVIAFAANVWRYAPNQDRDR